MRKNLYAILLISSSYTWFTETKILVHCNRQYLAIKATVLFHLRLKRHPGILGTRNRCSVNRMFDMKERKATAECQKCRPNSFSNSVVRRHDRSNEVDVAWRDLNHLKNPPSLRQGSLLLFRHTLVPPRLLLRKIRCKIVAIDLWTTKTKRWNIHVICRVSFYPAYYCSRTEIIMRLSDKERAAASFAESRTKKCSLELLPNERCIDRVVAIMIYFCCSFTNLAKNIYTQNLCEKNNVSLKANFN